MRDNIVDISLEKRVNYKILILFLLFFGFCNLLFTYNFSTLFFIILWLVLGWVFINLMFPKKTRRNSYLIFVLFFSVYFVYTAITNTFYIQDPQSDFFYSLDSIKFYNHSNYIVNKGLDLRSIFFQYRSFPAYGLLSFWITKTAYFFGENTVLIQKMHINFLTAFIPVFLFNINLKHLTVSRSFYIAIAFGFLTHIFTYSAILLRDMHIAVLYIYGFYLISTKFKFRNLILLLVLGFIVANFRLQNGLFFVLFFWAYLYKSFKNNKNFSLRLGMFFMFLLTISFSYYYFDTITLIDDLNNKLSGYEDYHEKRLESGSGFANLLNNKPFLIKKGAFIILSQVAPIPAHEATYIQTLEKYQVLAFPLAFALIAWLIALCFFIKGLVSKKIRKIIFSKLNISLLIAIIYILIVASSSPAYRRVLPVYPIIFLAAGLSYYKQNKIKRKKFIISIIIIYSIAMLLLSII